MNKEISSKSLLRIVIIGILVYCGIQNYTLVLRILAKCFNLVFPFVLGSIIAFIIKVPMKGIEKRLFVNNEKLSSLRRLLAYIITLLLIVGVFVICLFIIIPQVSDTVMLIVDRVPEAFDDFQKWIYAVTDDLPNVQSYIEKMDINWGTVSSEAIKIIKSAGGTVFSSGISVISSIVGGLTNFVVAFVFSIYVIFQKEKLSEQAKKLLYALFKEKVADRVIYVGRLANKIFSSFLSGQCIEAVILGMMFFVTLSLFRLPYAVLIGVVIAITALIPIFGSFIGCAIGAFLIVMVEPMQAVWFLIIFVVLQQIEGNLIYPHVVGGSIGLPSIWVLVAVMIGGNLMGVAGILLFIPLCSVLYSLCRDFVYKRLEERNIEKEKLAPLPELVLEDEEDKPAKEKKTRRKKTTEEKSEDNTK